MIRTVEITDYESHEHSVFNFTKGFNLLCGPSDAGKSSALRAICVAAYNRWSDDMVRVGCTKSTITVTTDKGYVTVERGPGVHKWNVGLLDNATGLTTVEKYEKLGRNVVPELALAVMCMPKIEIAGTDSLPNVMFQLDKHFLLAEFEGKSCSANMVAQVMDEISGLSGLEDLIKQISQDGSRAKRRLTDNKTKIDELTGKLIDEKKVETAKEKARKASSCLAELKENKARQEKMLALLNRKQRIEKELEGVRTRLTSFPDLSRLEKEVTRFLSSSTALSQMKRVAVQYNKAKEILGACDRRMKLIPDLKEQEKALDALRVSNQRMTKLTLILDGIKNTRFKLTTNTSIRKQTEEQLDKAQSELGELVKLDCPTCGEPLSKSKMVQNLTEKI